MGLARSGISEFPGWKESKARHSSKDLRELRRRRDNRCESPSSHSKASTNWTLSSAEAVIVGSGIGTRRAGRRETAYVERARAAIKRYLPEHDYA
jgi:hypothetical protein